MTTWYRAKTYNNTIEEIEVLSSTEKTVTLKRGRENRETQHDFTAETRQECIDWLKGRLIREFKKAEEAGERARKQLADFQTKYGVES